MLENRIFRMHWADWDGELHNSHEVGRWRANDDMSGLVDWMQERFEGALNGLMLIRIPERIYQRVDHAEFYAEVWSGHPGNFNKRFMLNGKGTYLITDPIVEDNHCNFIYPEIPLRPFHLVQGVNAVQLSVDRGLTFVGNFIVYNACIRTYLVPNHPDLAAAGLEHFTARVGIHEDAMGDQVHLHLEIEPEFLSMIESVEFHGCYIDFDDNGGGEYAWRGFTHRREPRNILGSAQQAPFQAIWDTTMIPQQNRGMAVRALVHLVGGFHYWTPVLDGLRFPADRPKVNLFYADKLPHPFWVRDGREQKVTITLPDNANAARSAILWVRIWDGGEGTEQQPFTLNGHPIPITSKRAVHDVVFTRVAIEPDLLRPGPNEIVVKSQTKEHGIEVLFPGPAISLRW